MLSSLRFSSVTQSCLTLCDPMNHSTPGFPVHHQLQEFIQTQCIKLVMPSSHLILCHPLLLLPPALGFFPMSQLFTWVGQCIGVSASVSVLPMITQGWSPLGWTGWISSQSKGLSRIFSNTTSILWRSAFFTVQLSHPYMTTGKNITLTRLTFVGKVMSLLFNMLSRLVTYPSKE